MKPAKFDYIAPESIDEAVSILAEEGDNARLLAGGQSLIAMMNMRLVKPGLVIDISRMAGQDSIVIDDHGIRIHAAATQRSLLESEALDKLHPLLGKALPWVGHFQTRSKGTVCGSVAHADPSSEIPLCLAVLNGQVNLRSYQNTRCVEAKDFQTGILSTACRANEMIESVFFPRASTSSGYAFTEFGYRHGDFAIVAVAVVASGDSLRIGVGGMTDKPEVRDFPTLADEDIDDALNDFAWELGGADDQHATAHFRRNLVRKLGRKSIEEATQCHS